MEETPAFVSGFMEEMKSNIEEVFDLKTMVVQHLCENKELLNEIFLRFANIYFAVGIQ